MNMREALKRTYDATPAPKWVVASGACAADGGVFAGSYAIAGGVVERRAGRPRHPRLSAEPGDAAQGPARADEGPGEIAIYTTRKRLLSIPNVRPFVVQNLGKYERQVWAGAEFGAGAEAAARQRAYVEFILKLANATPIHGYTWLHGIKAGRMIYVGAVDAPVASAT